VLVEDRLGLGLGQEQQERVGGVVQADVEQRKLRGTGAGVQLHAHGGVAAFDEGVGQAEAGENFEGAGLYGQGAGLMHLVGLAVDDPEPGPERLELGGEGQPGGSGADDEQGHWVAWW